MSSAGQASGVVSARYANALIELAEEAKKLDKVEQDLKDIQAMLAESDDLVSAIRSPVIGESALKQAMNAIADKAKFQGITKNFLNVLIENRRLNALDKISEAFFAALAERKGALTVDVQVAQDLSSAQKKELQDALSQAMGADVTIRATVEPSILGGMVVTVGSRMIDNSVRRKLERLKATMGGSSANQNSTPNSSKLSEVK